MTQVRRISMKGQKKAKKGSLVLLVGELDIHNDKLYIKLHNFEFITLQPLHLLNQSIAPHHLIKQPPKRGHNYMNPSLNSLHLLLNNLQNDRIRRQHQNQHHPYPLLTVQVKKNKI